MDLYNKLTVGEEGRIGSELSTRLTENQETQLRFAASRNAEPSKGVAISWLLLEQKSDRSISIKKRPLDYLMMFREFLIFSAVVLHKEKHLAIRASKPKRSLLG